MNSLVTFFLWVLASAGGSDICEPFAGVADVDASACAVSAPAPPPEAKQHRSFVPSSRRISNGF